MENDNLLRSVFEIRYQAAAHFFDNRGKIAERWHQDKIFDEWIVNPTHVSLSDKNKGFNFSVTHNRMAFDADLMDINTFCKHVGKIGSWTSNIIKIKRIDRIGLRLYFVYYRESFEAVYKSMMRQVFNLKLNDWEVFGGKPLDIGFPLTLQFDDCLANFKMGPMKKDQILSTFNYKNDKIIEHIPKASFFIDFDLYQKLPKISLNSKKMFDPFLEQSKQQIFSTTLAILNRFEGFEK